MKRFLIAFLLCGAVHGQTVSVIAHRPDMVPEPVFFENELEESVFNDSRTWVNGHMEGNHLVDFSPARSNVTIQSPCAVFNAAGDYVTFGNLSTSHTSLLFEGWFYTSIGTYFSSADNGIQLRNNGGNIQLFDRLRHVPILSTSGIDVRNRWVFLRLTRDTTTGYTAIYVDDMTTPVAAINTDTGLFAFTEFEIGRWQNTSFPEYMNGSCAGFRLVLDGIEKINCPLTESSGTTIYDVSGNGNHGTATITSSEAEFWGGTQTNSHYFAENGGSKVLKFSAKRFVIAPSISGDFIYEALIEPTSLGYNACLLGKGAATRYTRISPSGDLEGNLYIDGGFGTITLTNKIPLTGLYKLKIIAVSATKNLKIYINDVLTNDITLPFTLSMSGADSLFGRGSGSSNFSGKFIWCRLIYGTETNTYLASGAYLNSGTLVIPDYTGTNTAVSVEGGHVNGYIPALADGTDDAAGFGLTNPSGLVHNNGPQSLVFGGFTNSYASLQDKTNAFKVFYTEDSVEMVAPAELNTVSNYAGLVGELYVNRLSASMPLSLWTNSVLWLTAESPVSNAGTTNAQWLCYAKTCAGPATQPVINSQPTWVYTNGAPEIRNDGVDDCLLLSPVPFSDTDSFEISAVVKPNWSLVGDSGAVQIYSHGYYGATGILEFLLRGSSTYRGLVCRVYNTTTASYLDVRPTLDQSSLLSDGAFHTVKVVGSPTRIDLFIDGVNVGGSDLTGYDISNTADVDRVFAGADVINTPAPKSLSIRQIIVRRFQ